MYMVMGMSVFKLLTNELLLARGDCVLIGWNEGESTGKRADPGARCAGAR
jgi:hypothetical protein